VITLVTISNRIGLILFVLFLYEKNNKGRIGIQACKS
jgi:hypothetical protein